MDKRDAFKIRLEQAKIEAETIESEIDRTDSHGIQRRELFDKLRKLWSEISILETMVLAA